MTNHRAALYDSELQPLAIVDLCDEEVALLSSGWRIKVRLPSECPPFGWITDGPAVVADRALYVSGKRISLDGCETLLLVAAP